MTGNSLSPPAPMRDHWEDESSLTETAESSDNTIPSASLPTNVNDNDNDVSTSTGSPFLGNTMQRIFAVWSLLQMGAGSARVAEWSMTLAASTTPTATVSFRRLPGWLQWKRLSGNSALSELDNFDGALDTENIEEDWEAWLRNGHRSVGANIVSSWVRPLVTTRAGASTTLKTPSADLFSSVSLDLELRKVPTLEVDEKGDETEVLQSTSTLSSLSELAPAGSPAVAPETGSIPSLATVGELFPPSTFKVKDWDTSLRFSDYVRDGLAQIQEQASDASAGSEDLPPAHQTEDIIMVYDGVSSATDSPSLENQSNDTASFSSGSFCNRNRYKFHGPSHTTLVYQRTELGPCRYSSMTGSTFATLSRTGAPSSQILQHWESVIPNFVRPKYVERLDEDIHTTNGKDDSRRFFCYLPVEEIEASKLVHDPDVHYHLCGKDILPLISNQTTRLLPDTRTERPCIVKTTHSMGSRGIFVIRDDEDEAEFFDFLNEAGNPPYIVTEYVEVARNVACHFFIHPISREITWFGSNENFILPDGTFSTDSYMDRHAQPELQRLQLPFAEEVAEYCLNLGFWGFCGVDVLFDKYGQGYLVDLNPRMTGSCPSIMVGRLLEEKHGLSYGIFRRGGNNHFLGTPDELFDCINGFHDHYLPSQLRIVVFSYHFDGLSGSTEVNLGVYGTNREACEATVSSLLTKRPKDKSLVHATNATNAEAMWE